MDFDAALRKFRERFNQDGKGKKIAFMLTGGAYSTVDFRLGCGSSRFLEGCWDPYSTPQLAEFASLSGAVVDKNNFHSVEPHSADLYARALKELLLKTVTIGPLFPIIVASTSALSTIKYRRGDNRAYIGIIRELNIFGWTSVREIWKVQLDKLSEKEHTSIAAFDDLINRRRLEEDKKVSQAILAIIMKDKSMLPDLRSGENVTLLTYEGFKPKEEYEGTTEGGVFYWSRGI